LTVGDEYASRHPDLLTQLILMHTAPGSYADLQAFRQTWSSPGYDLLPKLAGLEAPTLVIHGDHDFVPVEVAAHIAQAIPGARLAVLRQCGHFSYLEAPDAVLQHISEFFAAESTAPLP
jgi:pimeloyl-ACP methyl ester carboxylesterase